MSSGGKVEAQRNPSGARAPSEAQEIRVGRGGVAGTMSSLKSMSVCKVRVTLNLDITKVEIVGVGGSLKVMMFKSHIA